MTHLWHEKEQVVGGLLFCLSCRHPDLLFADDHGERLFLCMKCGQFQSGIESPVLLEKNPKERFRADMVEQMGHLRALITTRQRPIEKKMMGGLNLCKG